MKMAKKDAYFGIEVGLRLLEFAMLFSLFSSSIVEMLLLLCRFLGRKPFFRSQFEPPYSP